jgi:Xaa-Pro aminopeptidase
MNDSDNVLIVADSDRDANMLYAVGMFVPDPFIYFRIDGKCNIVVPDLEMDRARKKASHCRIYSYNQCIDKLRRKTKRPGMAAVINLLFRERQLRKVFVPANFPHGLARELRNYKIKVRVKKGGIFPGREFKNSDEIKKISGALIMAEVGLAEGIQALKSSKVLRDGKLTYHGVPLTSEKLRGIIETAIVQAGGTACRTIVAGGRQACDAHEPGHGPLRANEPIVLDVFPRSSKTGYFGDITRTVVRGRASEAARRAYDTVARAQEIALTQLQPQTRAVDVHKAVLAYFDSQGYKTSKKNGRSEGFLHGTGHGLGMEINEAPRMGVNSNDILAAGQVVTIQPGLYYSEIGGIRLEDVAVITPQGHKNLTKFEKSLEI